MGLSSEAELRHFAAANNEFTVGLYQELRKNDGNLFLAPFSVRSVLTAVYAGARGRTALQMAEVLRLSGEDSDLFEGFREFRKELASRATRGKIEIDVADGLWRQTGMPLLAEFEALALDAFGAELFEADLANSPGEAARAIDSWVNKRTRGMTPASSRPESLAGPAALVMANAVYFSGTWALPFPKFATSTSDFHVRRGDPPAELTVKVPMMHQEGTFRYGMFEEFDAIEMPYRGGELAMVVLLPRRMEGWTAVEDRLSAARLSAWIPSLQPVLVNVFLPRFELRSSFGIEAALLGMGMADAFSLGTADFSGMTAVGPISIGSARHAAKIEVNEAGTRAGAATEISLALCMKPVFRADHPFLFIIRDVPTETILFIGRVLEPEWTEEVAEAPARPRRLTRLLRALGLK